MLHTHTLPTLSCLTNHTTQTKQTTLSFTKDNVVCSSKPNPTHICQ